MRPLAIDLLSVASHARAQTVRIEAEALSVEQVGFPKCPLSRGKDVRPGAAPLRQMAEEDAVLSSVGIQVSPLVGNVQRPKPSPARLNTKDRMGIDGGLHPFGGDDDAILGRVIVPVNFLSDHNRVKPFLLQQIPRVILAGVVAPVKDKHLDSTTPPLFGKDVSPPLH